jgi:hypothetical protein
MSKCTSIYIFFKFLDILKYDFWAVGFRLVVVNFDNTNTGYNIFHPLTPN